MVGCVENRFRIGSSIFDRFPALVPSAHRLPIRTTKKDPRTHRPRTPHTTAFLGGMRHSLILGPQNRSQLKLGLLAFMIGKNWLPALLPFAQIARDLTIMEGQAKQFRSGGVYLYGGGNNSPIR